MACLQRWAGGGSWDFLATSVLPGLGSLPCASSLPFQSTEGCPSLLTLLLMLQNGKPKEASFGHGRENSSGAGLVDLCELPLIIEGCQIIPHSYSLLHAG